MSEPLESELAGVGVDAPHQADFPLGDVRRHPEAPGDLHLGKAAAAPTYGELQVPSEDPPIDFELEAGDGEAPQPPAPSGPQTAPTATAGGAVGMHLQHVMTPNSDPPLLDESQDVGEDFEEPHPQDVGPSLPATSSSSSSFNPRVDLPCIPDRGWRSLFGVIRGGDRRPFCVCDGKGVTGGVTANELV
jgi:hypothetical protein